MRGRRSSIDRRAVWSYSSLLQCKCAPAESRVRHWQSSYGLRGMPGTGCVFCPFKTVAVNACPAAGNIQRLCRVECMQRHCCVGASFMHGPWRPPLCLCFLRLALGIGTTRAALPVYPVLLPATSALRLLHAPRLARSAMPAFWGHGWKQKQAEEVQEGSMHSTAYILALHSTRRSACM